MNRNEDRKHMYEEACHYFGIPPVLQTTKSQNMVLERYEEAVKMEAKKRRETQAKVANEKARTYATKILNNKLNE